MLLARSSASTMITIGSAYFIQSIPFTPGPEVIGSAADADAAGCADVDAGALPAELAGAGCCTGNCTITLPEPVLTTTWLLLNTSRIVSSHKRCRVTCGAAWYCGRIWPKRATAVLASATAWRR